MRKQPVIYIIRNIVNNKIYIGSAVYFPGRKAGHLSKLRKGKHTNKHLQNAWNKYGESNFIIDILEKIPYTNDTTFKTLLLEREQYYLDTYLYAKENTSDFFLRGYNKVRIAGNNLGHKFTDEQRRKLSEVHKGILHSEETKYKIKIANSGINNGFYGKKHTMESRKKMSDALIGRKMSDESNKKLSIAKRVRVIQFTRDKEFIKSWGSMMEAGDVLKICKQHISDVCRGKRKTAGNFYWEYEQT